MQPKEIYTYDWVEFQDKQGNMLRGRVDMAASNGQVIVVVKDSQGLCGHYVDRDSLKVIGNNPYCYPNEEPPSGLTAVEREFEGQRRFLEMTDNET